MNHLRREEIKNLRKHIFNELIDAGIPHAKHILIDAPIMAYLIRATRATKFWIAGKSSQHMTGHVDLWHDGDVSLCGIGHNLTDFSLGVIATIGCLVVKVRVGADNRTTTIGTDGNELGPLWNLDAPALIVGKVPMESVHVVHSEQVDELLDKGHREKMAGTVEMHTPPGKTRSIRDGNRRELKDTLTFCYAQRLTKGLDAIEDTSRRTAKDIDAILADIKPVTLRMSNRRRDGEGYGTHFTVMTVSDGEFQPSLLPDIITQEQSLALEVGSSEYLHIAVEYKRLSFLKPNILRQGYDIIDFISLQRNAQ